MYPIFVKHICFFAALFVCLFVLWLILIFCNFFFDKWKNEKKKQKHLFVVSSGKD